MNEPTKKSRGWRILRWGLIGFAIFITLAAVFHTEENWRGWQAWQKFKQQAEASGEKLDFASIIPPPVTDEQNFALAPIVASAYSGSLDKLGNIIVPPKTNVINRLDMDIRLGVSGHTALANTSGSWAKGATTDLKKWQRFYREAANPTNGILVSPEPQSPAADVLLALSKYDSNIDELRQASRRPLSRFPLNYDSKNPFAILLPHLTMRKCAQILQLRTLAELELGQSEKALADIKLSLRVMDSIRSEPFLISHLVRMAELQILLQPVYEGLAKHQWSDAELVELDRELSKLDFLADCQSSMRGERNAALAMIDSMRRNGNAYESLTIIQQIQGNDSTVKFRKILGSVIFLATPHGWFWLNEVAIGDMHQRWTLQMNDRARQLFHPKLAREADDYLRHLPRRPWNLFAALIMPAITPMQQKFGYSQNAVNMARGACALERFRLAHKEYPNSLDLLSPRFMDPVPHDVIGGQPLKYRRTDDGRFALYSLGWNETDEGGKVGLDKKGSLDMKTGDWVWEYPAP